MADSLIGTRLGKYEIHSEIGRGGMGAVYLAYDRPLDRWVAVKVLAPHLAWETAFVERFLREARAAAQLRHPSIVTIHDVGQEGSWYYFVMAHLAGLPLTKVIERQGPMPVGQALDILRPLAAALDYAHERGLVHRDVKPSNIIVEPTGQVTLTDFGIARAAVGTRLTATGVMVGTPEYMSPEQATGGALSPHTDQYALAVVAFEMLTGKVPFEAESTPALLHMLVYEPPPPLCTARPDLPATVEEALNRALAKEPADRFGSCGAFVSALEQAFDGARMATVRATPPPMAASPSPPPSPQPTPYQTYQPHPSPPVQPRPTLPRVPGWAWVAGGVLAVAVVAALAVIVALTWLNSSRGVAADGEAALTAQLTADARTAVARPTATHSSPTAAPATEEALPTRPPTQQPPTEPPPPTETPQPSRRELEAELLSRVAYREENGRVVFAYPVASPPSIDGRLNEWGGRAYEVPYEFRDPEVAGLIGNRTGNADLSGRFYIEWDADHLFIGGDVTDDVHVQIKQGRLLFQGDDIEIQLDADLLGDWDDAAHSEDDAQVGFSAGDFGALSPEAYIWLPASQEQPGTMITVAARQTGEGYTLEAAIPWWVLGGRPAIETPVGFCLSLSDNDAPGTAQQQTLMSTAPDRTWGDPTTWGTLILME